MRQNVALKIIALKSFVLLSNICPVSWKNAILYGDYIFNRNRIVR